MFVVTNKARLEECKRAIFSEFQGKERIFLLIGPCGSGRENTIRHLALGKDVITETAVSVLDVNPFDDGNFVANVTEILRFQARDKKLVILINDYDGYTMSRDSLPWKNTISMLRKSKHKYHRIFIVCPPEIYDKKQIFQAEDLDLVSEIRFNAVAVTILRKYLGVKANDLHASLFEKCGDFRSAQLNLEFAKLLPSRLKNPGSIGKLVPLSIFHGVGKVIYKSKSEYLHPLDIIESVFSTSEKFNAYLFENAINFCDFIEEYSNYSEHQSLSDTIKSKVQWSTMKDQISMYVGSLPSLAWICCNSRKLAGGREMFGFRAPFQVNNMIKGRPLIWTACK